MKAPFPYFGGKSTIASIVWRALGNVKHYIEPFCGSCAVLLNRPGYRPGEHIETINDADGYIANVWRSLQKDPEGVALHCDWPVSHVDLAARKKFLIRNEETLLRLQDDPDYYDPKIAGFWIWAASCWIGSGLTRLGQIPHLASGGMGVHALGQRPHLADGGMGVQEPYNGNIYAWFRALSERLRYVRTFCGDWLRVCGGDWQDHMGTVGIFFDPPYAVEDRDATLYHKESLTVAHDVSDWAIERGKRKSYRIVIAGYDEHAALLSAGWRSHNYKTGGGYSLIGKNKNNNRFREVLYFSPYCETVVENQDLFGSKDSCLPSATKS